MVVKENVKGNAYKKLLEYVFSKCNVIRITKINYNLEETPYVIEKLLTKIDDNVEEITMKYSENYLHELYEKLKDDEDIFDKNYNKIYGKTSFSLKTSGNLKFYRMSRYCYLSEILEYIIYNYNTSIWLKKYKGKILYKKDSNHGMQYYIRLNEALKKELIDKSSLFEWNFPDSVEDISFYKDSKCWLCTEYKFKTIEIYCEDAEEYKYLKSIGIKFREKNFIPAKKN